MVNKKRIGPNYDALTSKSPELYDHHKTSVAAGILWLHNGKLEMIAFYRYGHFEEDNYTRLD